MKQKFIIGLNSQKESVFMPPGQIAALWYTGLGKTPVCYPPEPPEGHGL
jgi:hypothetical protein